MLKKKDKNFFTGIRTDYDESVGTVNIIPEEIGKVLLNVIGNSFYAITEKKNQPGSGYKPFVSVSTKKIDFIPGASGIIPFPRERGKAAGVEIRVRDNGTGIPKRLIGRVFHLFFTKKPPARTRAWLIIKL
ncbi:MAG: hypothetical protein ABI416_18020 [Ginsengibacter sp.]